MGKFRITGPDGKQYNVTGETAEGALQALQQHLGEPPTAPDLSQSMQPQAEPDAVPWYTPITSAPGNAYDAAASIAGMVRHPVDTIEGIAKLGSGAINNAVPQLAGVDKWLAEHGMKQASDPQAVAEQQNIASSVGHQAYENFKTPTRAWNTLATHPIDTLLAGSGGIGALGKVAEVGNMAKTAGALAKVSEFTNPVNLVAKPVSAMLPVKTLRPVIRTEEALQADKNAKYGAVKRAGMSYTEKSTSGLVDNIYRNMERDGFDMALHPKSAAMIKNLERFRTSSPSLHELDKARQIIRRDIITPDPLSADAHFGQIMIKKIDKFAEHSSPKMMTNSNMVQDPGKLLTDARKANVAFRKTEMVNDKLDRGDRQAMVTGKGTNQDNALRQKINEIINEKKGNTFRTFSPAEQQQMEQTIVRGTKARNAARKVGALAPTGIVSGGIGSSIGATIGSYIGGPVGAGIGAVALPAVGQGAKMLGDIGTRRAIDDLLRIIQNGGKKLPKGARTSANDKALIKALIAGRLGEVSTATQPR